MTFKNSFAEMLALQNNINKQQKEQLQEEVTIKTHKISALYEQLLSQYKTFERIAYEQSHLVRGPLATIMGLVSLLKEESHSGDVEILLRYLDTKVLEMDKVILAIVAAIEK
ncbi:hypothetical protein ABDD95_18855 [Mucilaginibacter sp. PAMB04274]|uniref:hypothetical protein n=1 Tax=Mucilaginibacter sp. PAMB04274 TaxID=3138568 RepID=UPI0031F6B280